MNDTTNNAVLRYRDGRTEMCELASDLSPNDTVVQIRADGAASEVDLAELKAVFFLRHQEGEAAPAQGSTLSVEFFDGEVIRGISTGYSPGTSGFFLYPLDRSKNEKVFVVNSAVVSADVEKL